jgi:hypothetical protein
LTIIFLLGCPVVWKSKQQQSVTLSSSEAEYVALSKAAKEIKFVVQYPTTMHVDNIGAIVMSENGSATKHTGHVNTRYRFVCVLSRRKTKNVKSEIYDHSVLNYMLDKQQFDSRAVSESEVSLLGFGLVCVDATQFQY